MIEPLTILVVDDLTFELRRSARRTTLGLTVDRDASLVLHAPADIPLEHIEGFARAKQEWVYTKLAHKRALQHPPRRRELIPGEGFLYIGRSYRLRIAEDDELSVPLLLRNGWFTLRRSAVEHGYEEFKRWYRAHALSWIEKRAGPLASRIEAQPTALTVRSLGHRWGSCSAAGRVSFHWRTILLPSRIAEYVIAHELVHLHERHHGAAFWERLERAMPDYQQRRDWLDAHGAEYDL